MAKSSQFMFATRARDAALTHLITRLIWYDHLMGRHILRPFDSGKITINVGPFFEARAEEKGDHNMGAAKPKITICVLHAVCGSVPPRY